MKRVQFVELKGGSRRVQWSLGLVFAQVVALTFFAVSTSSAQPAGEVTIDRPVVDQVGVLRPITVDALGQTLQAHQDQTGVQIAVLIVETTGGVPIEDYSLAVAQRWGGGAAGRDDGVLVTLAIEDRQNRIEVGYGLEHRLTDGGAAQILQNAVAPLHAGDYDRATQGIVEELIESTSAGAPAAEEEREKPGKDPSGQWPVGGFILIGVFLIWIGSGVGATGQQWHSMAQDKRAPLAASTALALAIPLIGSAVIFPVWGVVPTLLYALCWWMGLILGMLLASLFGSIVILPLGASAGLAPLGILFLTGLVEGGEARLILSLIAPILSGAMPTTFALAEHGNSGEYSSGGLSSSSGGGSSGGGGSFGGGGASGSW